MIAAEHVEMEACLAGEDWARNTVRPSVNMVDVVNEHPEMEPYFESPWVFASLVKGGIDVHIPRLYEQAMKDPNLWMPAMQKEYDTLVKRDVWELVEKPEGVHLLEGMWVYNLKVKGDGSIVKSKGRYVLRGDLMWSDEYGSKWAMVARMESTRMLIAIGAVCQLYFKQWDFLAAYLNGWLDKPAYMKQPKGFVKPGEESKVYMLKQLLYGMVQAGHI